MKKLYGILLGLVIGLSGLVFSACTPSYDNVRLVLSTNSVEMALGTQATFSLEIENYVEGMNNTMQLNYVDNLFRVVEQDSNKNKVFFRIEATKVGSTNVEIISVDGAKTCNLTVTVFEAVQSFSLKSDPFIVKRAGTTYTLSEQSYFNFEPSDARISPVEYKLDNDIITAVEIIYDEILEETIVHLLTDNNKSLVVENDEFTLKASLVDYPAINAQDITFTIIEPINYGNINLIQKGVSVDGNYIYITESNAQERGISFASGTNAVSNADTINLISSSLPDAYYLFEVQCETKDVTMEVYTENGICLCGEKTIDKEKYSPTSTYSKFFDVQEISSSIVGDDIIYIKLSNEFYSEILKVNINVSTTPYAININNIMEFEKYIVLYDFNDHGELYYYMTINVLDKISHFKSVTCSVVSKTEENVETLSSFNDILEVSYKTGLKTTTFDIPYEDFLNNSLINPIVVMGKKTQDVGLYFRFVVNNDNGMFDERLVIDVPFVVKAGAQSFTIKEKYADGIDINLSEENEIIFDGFDIKNELEAYIGEYTFQYNDNSDEIFTLEQVIDEFGNITKKVKITPHQVGKGSVKIKLPNGLFAILKINVGQELSDASISMVESDFLDTQEGIIYAAYTQPTSINNVQKLYFNINPEPSNASIYNVVCQVNNADVLSVVSSDLNQVVVALLGIYAEETTLTINIQPIKYEDFKFVASQTDDSIIKFEYKILSYSPIANLEFVNNGSATESVSIYRSSDVGYYYEHDKAIVNCSIRATLKDGTVIDDVTTRGIKYTTQTGPLDNKGSYSVITNYGIIVEKDKNDITFTCEDKDRNVFFANTSGSVWFQASLFEHGREITRTLTINIEEFTPLEYINIANYQPELYLSGKQSSFTFFTSIVPSNADCQRFEAIFVPDKEEFADLFDIEVTGNCSEVTITHKTPDMQGYGYIYFVPRTAIGTDGTFDKTNMQKIRVYYSDGTDKNNPELLSSVDEFIEAMSDENTAKLHYLITTTLDFSGKDLSGIKNITGSITGGNATAKLTNILIDTDTVYGIVDSKRVVKRNNIGLFQKIGKDAEINNLIIEGKIDLSIDDFGTFSNFNIGLLAGVNDGTLNNVTVNLTYCYVAVSDSASTKSFYIGGIVGENNGTINSLYYTVSKPTTEQIKINNITTLSEGTVLKAGSVINGGAPYTKDTTLTESITVDNDSIIKAGSIISNGSKINAIAIPTYNHCLITNNDVMAIIYVGNSTNTGFGGVAGKNLGTISRTCLSNVIYNNDIYTANIKVKTQGFNNVGGICGVNEFDAEKNTTIKNQIVTGSIESTIRTVGSVDRGGEKVGGIAGTSSGFIVSNTSRISVKAIDYGAGVVGFDEESSVQNNRIQNNKVQAIKTANLTPMIRVNKTFCGAIAGNETPTRNTQYKANGNTAQYYWTNPDVYPIVYSLSSITYQGHKAESESLFKRVSASITITGIDDTTNEGNVYEMQVGSYETDISTGNQVFVENAEYAHSVIAMFLYTAQDETQQSFINYKNTNLLLPFVFVDSDAVILSSLTTDILTINSSGQITLKSTGLAKIKVTSLLDTTVTKMVYIHISNAFDSFYLQRSDTEIISSSSAIKIYNNSPKYLEYRFAHKDVNAVGASGQNINVKLEYNQMAGLDYLYSVSDDGVLREPNADEYYTKMSINGNILIFSVNNDALNDTTKTHENIITFVPTYEVQITDTIFAKIQSVQNTMLSQNMAEPSHPTIITLIAKRGTSNLQLNVSTTVIEPMYEIKVDINQVTDDDEDYIKIYSIKIDDTTNANNDYFIATPVGNYVYNQELSNQTLTQVFNKGTDGEFVLQFNYAKYGAGNYAGTYYVNFVAKNDVYQTLEIEVKKQEIINITTRNYYDVGNNFELTNLQSNNVAANATNILVVDVYPFFAEFDYILIDNDSGNFANNNKILLEIVAYDEITKTFSSISGIQYSSTGATITKDILARHDIKITSSVSRLFVRYTTTSYATIDTIAKIQIYAMQYNETADVMIYDTYVGLNVIARDSVYFTFDTRQNTQENKYYVAKGVSYDMSLHISGFSEDQAVVQVFDKDNNVIFDNTASATNNANSLVKLSKESGKYQLKIENKYINYTENPNGYYAKVVTFGQREIDGVKYTSGKTEMELFVEDFVILTENMGAYYHSNNISTFNKQIAVAKTTNAVAHIAVGNKLPLAVGFIPGVTVEYDTTDEQIYGNVLAFEKALTENSTWTISTDKNNVLGKYVYSCTLGSGSLTTEYIKIQNLNVTPLRINNYQDTNYYFTFNGEFYYSNGQPRSGNNINSISLYSDFLIDVYQNSTAENAIPVYSYEELVAMNDSAYYILMNDITLPNTFTPLTNAVASFDGNGHTINFPDTITWTEGTNFGLFATVSEKTILKNIKVKISSFTNISIEVNSANFGVIAGENKGAITNCEVFGSGKLTVLFPNQNFQSEGEGIYVAGFVAHNLGYITNSRYSVNLLSVANVAGFVALNENKIASSYVRDCKIENKSSSSSHTTAGFVLKNGLTQNSKAIILTSYIVGETSSANYDETTNAGTIYSTNTTTKCIDSDCYVSAFVYDNFGNVQDCYADIFLSSGGNVSGFVFNNGGKILRSYSTSGTLNGNSARGFVQSNIYENSQGVMVDCFYLVGVNQHTAYTSNEKHQGLEKLNSQYLFSKNSGYFVNYAISTDVNKTDAVWFYPSKSSEVDFKNGTQNIKFTYGKPELVAPNLVTYSEKEIDSNNTTINAQTGETVYAYSETKATEGSKNNPIVIYSAETFEAYILNNSFNNINSNCYRIVKDIDYVLEKVYSSQTYNTILVGDIEGNGMAISNFSIETVQTCNNAGLFAQIGKTGIGGGVVKNLILQPKYLNFPNTSCAGTLAGTLDSGRLFNIDCDGITNVGTDNNKLIKIIGQNAVGGIVGLACNNFRMVNVKSSVSADATYDHMKSDANAEIYSSTTNLPIVSYAGVIAGITASNGIIVNATVYGECYSIGEFAGLLFGKIGSKVSLSNTNVVLEEKQSVIPSIYGGVIAGELNGSLSKVVVSGVTSVDFFKNNTSNYAVAVGGLVGLLNGGTIDQSSFSASLTFANLPACTFGGMVGEAIGGNITNSTFVSTNFTVLSNEATDGVPIICVGGIAGKISVKPSMEFISLPESSAVNLDVVRASGAMNINVIGTTYLYVGGIVGLIQNSYETSTKTSAKSKNAFRDVIANIVIDIENTLYNGMSAVYVGGIAGAVFAETNLKQSGELMIFDNASSSVINNKSESQCSMKVNVNIIASASAKLYFGGILGFGYTVNSYAQIDKIPSKYNSWGGMLMEYYTTTEDGANAITTPNYYGREFDEDLHLISMVESEYFKTNLSEVNYIENNR